MIGTRNKYLKHFDKEERTMKSADRNFIKRLTLWCVCLGMVMSLGCTKSCETATTTQTDEADPAFVKKEERDISHYEDKVKAEWAKLKVLAKAEWDKFTDQDLAEIEGNFHTLVAKIQEKYAISKEEAEKMIRSFVDKHN